jgi:phosphodiesterase/alkaline phosphatase D-like protein
MAFVVCQDYGNGYYTAFAHLAQEQQVDYVLHLGDYIYETITSNFQGNRARTVPPVPQRQHDNSARCERLSTSLQGVSERPQSAGSA